VRLYAIHCKAEAEKIARRAPRSRKLGGLAETMDSVSDPHPA
jgi:hypothetical protein